MSSYKQISVEETKEMISSDIYLLDIRDKASYSSSHISGAIHVSNESIDEFVANADKIKEIAPKKVNKVAEIQKNIDKLLLIKKCILN